METANTQHQLTLQALKPFYGARQVVQPITMTIAPRQITAIVGPSGCGKSTVLRCLNRMHETIAGARVEGTVLLDDENIYAPNMDAALVRRTIGMIFQQPIALRTRSIYENVAVGLRLGGVHRRAILDERVERSLRAAALWDEVKDKLGASGMALSGGQQQRLSIARALAVEPDVLLLDEPCSALDLIATLKIEELMIELRREYTIVIVTHNMQEAARASDDTAFMLMDPETRAGQLVEIGPTQQIFTNPKDKRTEDCISGRSG
jgi:phosphate transport system ATP-binding protein